MELSLHHAAVQALRQTPTSAKACFRAGQAHVQLQAYQQAVDILGLGMQMHPDHPQLVQLFETAQKFLRGQQAAQAESRRSAAHAAWQLRQTQQVLPLTLHRLHVYPI